MSTKQFEIIRMLLHGFFLISVNLFSILLSFSIYAVLKPGNQMIFQTAIALVINLGIYFLVYYFMSGLGSDLMKVKDIMMLLVTVAMSMALLPTIFYPIHYLHQGYWSSVNNLFVIWPYQFVVNSICLIINYFVIKDRR